MRAVTTVARARASARPRRDDRRPVERRATTTRATGTDGRGSSADSRSMDETLPDGRVNRFTTKESGERRRERAVIGFWQTFAERASEARRKHFDGRRTTDGKAKAKGR